MEVFLFVLAIIGIALSSFFTFLYKIIMALLSCLWVCINVAALVSIWLPFCAVVDFVSRAYWRARRKMFLG